MDASGAPVFGSVCLCNTSLCNGSGVASPVAMVPNNMDLVVPLIPLIVVLFSCLILCVCNGVVLRGYTIRRKLIKGISKLYCLQRENGRQVQKYVNGWFANKWSWEYTYMYSEYSRLRLTTFGRSRIKPIKPKKELMSLYPRTPAEVACKLAPR